MRIIKWGMIGAGDVTEVKSGPAFKKVPNSDLIAVMRRDADKVRDFAERHEIQSWYTDADELIANPDIDAVYIATPPHVHLTYIRQALRAGKMVYVEKPVALNTAEAEEIKSLVDQYQVKLVVAHYRRAIPYFVKIKELIESNVIGQVSLINLKMFKNKLPDEALSIAKNQWRVDPKISGGGLFHDLAPHQLDLMIAIFGHPVAYNGLSDAIDNEKGAVRVAGQMIFKDNILFNGVWDFDKTIEADVCEIIGSTGMIEFSFFNGVPIVLRTKDVNREFVFSPLLHVQEPMIAQVVQYFLGEGNNPCPIEEGVVCMQVMDEFTRV